MTYLERLSDTRIKFNNSRLNKKDGKAWDNRKGKGGKQYDPRGSVVKRLRALERSVWWDEMKYTVNQIATGNLRVINPVPHKGE